MRSTPTAEHHCSPHRPSSSSHKHMPGLSGHARAYQPYG